MIIRGTRDWIRRWRREGGYDARCKPHRQHRFKRNSPSMSQLRLRRLFFTSACAPKRAEARRCR
jgi:hypothetical protein